MVNPDYIKCTDTERSLEDAYERVHPFLTEVLRPALVCGRLPMILASTSVVRAIIQHIEGLSTKAVEKIDVSTSVSLVYELDKDFQPIRRYFLLEEGEIEAIFCHQVHKETPDVTKIFWDTLKYKFMTMLN